MRITLLPSALPLFLATAGFWVTQPALAPDSPAQPSTPAKSDRTLPSAAEVRVLTSPLMLALDADKDGELSAEELQNATAALKKLDQNNDGKVDRTELRPVPRNPDGARNTVRTNMPPAEIRRLNRTKFMEQIMSFDADKNGRLTKEELPERMRRVVEQGDTNKDQVLDQEELKALSEQLGMGTPPNPPAQSPPPADPKP